MPPELILNYKLAFSLSIICLAAAFLLYLIRKRVRGFLIVFVIFIFFAISFGGGFIIDNAISPRGNLYGEMFWRGPENFRVVALTFDDGPQEPYTSQVLDILKSLQVRSTFFLVGQQVKKFPDLARRIAIEGHVIGNHSFDHANLIKANSAFIENEIRKGEKVIFEATGVKTTLFRPPHGFKNPAVFRVCRQMGYTVVGWSEMAVDWNEKDTQKIIDRIVEKAQNGAVILLHDGGGDRSRTVEALPEIIVSLQERGFRFVTIPQMQHLKG